MLADEIRHDGSAITCKSDFGDARLEQVGTRTSGYLYFLVFSHFPVEIRDLKIVAQPDRDRLGAQRDRWVEDRLREILQAE